MEGFLCMKLFKSLNHGTSLIEVMIAIAVLAIFGTSLFTMQQYLFNRMYSVQLKLNANIRMKEQLVVLERQILEELLEYGQAEKSLNEIVKNFKAPDMTITASTQSDFFKDEEGKDDIISLKDFKDLHLIKVQAEQDEEQYGSLYVFAYIPRVKKS